eukprot:m.257604 g.257604  ORF g.257604 m.257604 type:complete len:257 (+) comp22710_c0_seq20:1344-2114(+)
MLDSARRGLPLSCRCCKMSKKCCSFKVCCHFEIAPKHSTGVECNPHPQGKKATTKKARAQSFLPCSRSCSSLLEWQKNGVVTVNAQITAIRIQAGKRETFVSRDMLRTVTVVHAEQLAFFGCSVCFTEVAVDANGVPAHCDFCLSRRRSPFELKRVFFRPVSLVLGEPHSTPVSVSSARADKLFQGFDLTLLEHMGELNEAAQNAFRRWLERLFSMEWYLQVHCLIQIDDNGFVKSKVVQLQNMESVSGAVQPAGP